MALAVLRRILQMLFVMLGISIIVFLIFFATPGADPAARIAGRNASPDVLAAVRHDFGFDRPLYVQYALMMRRLFVTGDLTSFVNRGYKVLPAIADAIPATMSLVLGTAVLWVLFGIIIGTVAALTQNRWPDRVLMMLGLVGLSMPVFWVGSVVNLFTQGPLHDTWALSWVPALGYVPLTEDPAGWFKGLVFPWITMALLFIGIYGRVLRASLLEAYQEDFIRTARAKGLTETRILLRHALRTSLVTFVSLFGLDFGFLVGGGTLPTEVVFNIHGVGKLTVDALQNLDLPFVMATVMYGAFFVVAANAAVDIAYAALDPRVRLGRA